MVAVTLGLSLLIGLSLGLLGGGGSILTVPILTYVADMDPRNAIAAALFVVAVTSAASVVVHARAGRVMWRTGLMFGAAGMAGAYLGGRLAVFIPPRALMIGFGVMMVATAVAMLRPKREQAGEPSSELRFSKTIVDGFVIGCVTGLIGVGGGFLIVPALVLLGRIPMERAVGTSLLVIAMNSLSGLAGQLEHAKIDWTLALPVTAVAVVGSIAGGRLAGRMSPTVLRRAFGVLVVLVAVIVLGHEVRF
jgi:uncharacterized protein